MQSLKAVFSSLSADLCPVQVESWAPVAGLCWSVLGYTANQKEVQYIFSWMMYITLNSIDIIWLKKVHCRTADSQMPAVLRRCWSWSRGSSWSAVETTAPLLPCSAFVRAQSEPTSLVPEILDCWGPVAKTGQTTLLAHAHMSLIRSHAGFLSNTYRRRDLDAKFLHNTVQLLLYIITEIHFIYIHLS